MVQSVPDAAKPQHFCLEVEARFRDFNRSMHGRIGVSRWEAENGSGSSTSGTDLGLLNCARLICWMVNDL
jgi:hypothetical protein